MNLPRNFCLLAAVTLTLLFCSSVLAQGPSELTVADSAAAAPTATPAVPDTPTIPDAPAVPDAPAPTPLPPPDPRSQYPTGATSGDWRVGITVYGWFPGLHGTVGGYGHNASIHVPFSDVFHVLKGIVPVAVETDKGRFLMPVDFLWMKLGIDDGIPINDFGQSSVDTHMTQSILTPKFGYRLLDADHLKFDALGGIRYWHVGLDNTLEPSGISRSDSANWVDGLGGGRFILPLGERAAVTVAGDAGAGQADLDYQALGLLNFNITPKLGLAVGWRYLYEDYRPGGTNQFVYNPTISGAIAGFGYNFGGKPPVPPTASCSASPTQVFPGDQVAVTATTTGLNPKLNVLYTWSGDGVTGDGTTAHVNTSALNPGTYTVTGNIKEGKPGKEGLKPWEVASCSATYTVKEFEPPTISCAANPNDLKPGDSSTITAQAVSPQNRPLTYSYQASSGTISGSGNTATYSSAGASPGPMQITGTVADDKGHTASCSTSVNIQAPPPPPPQASPELIARLRLHSVFFPTALPTEKHPEGGLVESQQAILTSLAADFKTYLTFKPDAHLNLIGHADPRGTSEFNLKLSERRVARAKAFLVEQGVPEANIETQAVGDEHQLSKDEVRNLIETNPDLSDEQKKKTLRQLNVIVLAQNRRVDVRLKGSEQESALHYPFNAADSATLLDLKKPASKTTRKK
jgi:outer membrane protein OmpA-like peptidoglycan-associated protein